MITTIVNKYPMEPQVNNIQEPLHSLHELIEELKRQNQVLSELIGKVDNIGNRINRKDEEDMYYRDPEPGKMVGLYEQFCDELKLYSILNGILSKNIIYVEQYI